MPERRALRSVVHTTVPARRVSAERNSSPASTINRTRVRAVSTFPPQHAAAAWRSVSDPYRVASASSRSSATVRIQPSLRAPGALHRAAPLRPLPVSAHPHRALLPLFLLHLVLPPPCSCRVRPAVVRAA
ncbi:hypothetical protein GCM10018987_17620 [Streptomyces cremeus]